MKVAEWQYKGDSAAHLGHQSCHLGAQPPNRGGHQPLRGCGAAAATRELYAQVSPTPGGVGPVQRFAYLLALA